MLDLRDHKDQPVSRDRKDHKDQKDSKGHQEPSEKPVELEQPDQLVKLANE